MKFEMLKCDKCGKKFEISAMSDCFQVNIESLHMADGTFSELNVAELCPECHNDFLFLIRSYCSRGRFAPLDAPNEDDKKCHDCKHYPKNGITANAICLKCEDHSEYLGNYSKTSETSETSEAAKDEKPQIERLVFHNITAEQAKNLGLYSEDVDKVTKENLEKQAKIWKAPEIKVDKSEAAKDIELHYDDLYKLWNKASEIEAENNNPKKAGMRYCKTYKGKPTKRGDIRFYIIQNELTLQQIADKCGVRLNYVYKIKKNMKDKGEI